MRRARRAAVAIAASVAWSLIAGGVEAAASNYAWMSENFEGNVSLVYGSPETGEDMLFFVYCDNQKRRSELAVYEEIEGASEGEPLTIEIEGGAGKISLQGKTATDEMNGFIYGMAENFPVKPLIGALTTQGDASVKMSNVTAALPEAGRAEAVSAFDRDCKLD